MAGLNFGEQVINIRNYIGDTGTNRAIRRTATSNPDEFFYANNGICAVATRIREDESDDAHRTLLCDGFSIINGAQTVRSLSKAQGENSEAVRGVQVLLRLVEYNSKLTLSEQAFLDNVIRNNNTQNTIKVSDFRSNDKVQVSLKQHFSKLPAFGGKTFVYRNKRTGERDSLHIPIPLEELIKTVHAFRFGPDDMFGGTTYLFSTESDGGYYKLFGEDGEIRSALTQPEFQEIAGTWFLCEYARNEWKSRPEELQIPALERRWLVFWAIGESLRVLYEHMGVQVNDDIRKLSNPFWMDPEDRKGAHFRAVIKKQYELAIRVLKKTYAASAVAEDFSHRNWFRTQSTLTRLHDELQELCEFTSQLAHQYVFSIKSAGS